MGDVTLTRILEKTGVPRILEALESNDWAATAADDFLDGSDDDFGEFASAERVDELDDERNLDLGVAGEDQATLRTGILSALADGGDEDGGQDEVERVEKMMRTLLAAREAGEGMGEEERKRMAKRAVEKVMGDL